LGNGIYQVAEGSADGGARLISTEAYELVYDLQWQPDGSGFLFTKLSYDENFVDSANIYAYSLASGETTQLTNFTAEFARDINMSPDGQRIVFEWSPTQEFETIDLYIMARDGSEMRLLFEDGRLPSWSGMAAPQQKPWHLPYDEIADFIAEVQRRWDQIREAVSNDE
jgi:Tol biopolymer transport system component